MCAGVGTYFLVMSTNASLKITYSIMGLLPASLSVNSQIGPWFCFCQVGTLKMVRKASTEPSTIPTDMEEDSKECKPSLESHCYDFHAYIINYKLRSHLYNRIMALKNGNEE